MAKTQQTNESEGIPPHALSIEELKEKKHTPAAIFCGLCAAMGWRPGKRVTERDYDIAVVTFASNLIGRREW